MAKGMPCTRHRVFLATLIVACKYLNDSAPKIKHWAEYAGNMFDPAEINLMEKQLLFLLDYDLRFDESEAIVHFAPFMPRLSPSVKETRAAAVHCAKARVQAHVAMPPTPPHEEPSPTSIQPVPMSGVQNLVKRLSSTYLAVSLNSSTSARPRAVSRISSSSTLYSDSTASGDSDSGTASSDCGVSPTSTEASSVFEGEDDKPNMIVQCDNICDSASACIKQGRKISSSSVSTVKMDGPVSGIAATSILKAWSSTGHSAANIPASRADCGTHRNSLSHSATSNGFLSRMWGAATKTQERSDANVTDAVGTNTFRRRLTHSRSAFFRSHHTQPVDA